jgi:hypothetical protein
MLTGLLLTIAGERIRDYVSNWKYWRLGRSESI